MRSLQLLPRSLCVSYISSDFLQQSKDMQISVTGKPNRRISIPQVLPHARFMLLETIVNNSYSNSSMIKNTLKQSGISQLYSQQDPSTELKLW